VRFLKFPLIPEIVMNIFLALYIKWISHNSCDIIGEDILTHIGGIENA